MDKQQAQNIIGDTFETSFDKDRFTGFIKNLLNRIDVAPFTYRGNYIPDAYKQYIKTLERIGKFSDGESSIDILVITLQKETSLERARTMQRNFVAWYLNGSRGGVMKDAALVAYVSPDKGDWRFSLVKMDYKFEQSKSGRMKVKEEFTPARRWSFLVGKNERSHTAQSRLVNILKNDEHDPTLEEIEKAFDIETVTKEFFLKYRELFLRTKDELDKVVNKDPRIKADFEEKGVDTVNVAKKLLGQIVFLYFLQKKGWFGVGRDNGWGTGSKHFLRGLFEKKHGDYHNFFNDILEPLFYEALRIDRSYDDDYYSRFDCKIPFLNGGLFDPIGNYDWVHTDIIIPDRLFSNTVKTREGDTGNGILDVFDRYNFTVKEDEPLEKEVAIDPELLGKAYEKFNAIRPDNFQEYKKALKSGKKGEESKFNKRFGVYYTPREIVHYMCQQTLISYLHGEFNAGPVVYERLTESQLDMYGNKVKDDQLDLTITHGLNSQISREDVEVLIRLGEQAGENDARVGKEGKETKTYSYKLPQSIRRNAELIDEKLANIRVCDPAVGSGAFPVGMMHEIVKARNVLSTFIGDRGRTVYDFKRRCIEDSLYGVDIDPGAVEIAKLRLWLSLIVDEEDIKSIKPLPNLDYKIVCGDSLLGVERNLLNHHLFKELEEQKTLYFNETNPARKAVQKRQIDDLIHRITNGHREFDFEVYFSEVFHQKGGFDVVIANPPYITVALGKKQKFFTDNEIKVLKDKYRNVFEYKGNTYSLFLARSIFLLGKHSVLTFITPNTLLLNSTLQKTRQFILANCTIEFLINIKDRVFEHAETAGNLITILSKGDNKDHMTGVRVVDEVRYFGDKPNYNLIDQRTFASNEGQKFYLDARLGKLLKKISSDSIPLGDVVKFYQGIITGDNKKFLNNAKIDNRYERILRGRNIHRYYYSFGDTYILFDEDLLWSNTNRGFFQTRPKLINRQTGDSLIAAYDDKGFFALDSTHIQLLINQKFDLKFILALFNSMLFNFYYNQLVEEEGRVFAQVKIVILKTLPVKNVVHTLQKPFITLVDKILVLTQSDDYLQNLAKQVEVKAYKKGIDHLVYKLYDLTPEEIKIVEGENENAN